MTNHRFETLDAMRGVAAICVLCFHIFEALAFAAGQTEQQMFHGFLAVDFFFILSGFVMGYAYNHRWQATERRLTFWRFVRLRLIRLHPMVVAGVTLGTLAFVLHGCDAWDGTVATPWQVAGATVLALLMIPAPICLDVRGNTEAFPLNGPHWSLLFEYVGSLLYALVLRRLPSYILTAIVVTMGIVLTVNGLMGEYGTIAYGWSSEPTNLWGGLLRMMFAYPLGLLLAASPLTPLRGEGDGASPLTSLRGEGIWRFWGCALGLIALLCMPSLSTLTGFHPANIIYEVLCIAFIFPLIVRTCAKQTALHSHRNGSLPSPRRGAGGEAPGCKAALGALSYPLYAIHYPLIYLYIQWLNSGHGTEGFEKWAMPIGVFLAAITLGYISLRFWETPMRRWLSNRG